MQDPKNTNTLGNSLEIDGVGEALIPSQSISDEAVIAAETRIFGDGLDLGMEHFAVTLGLIQPEMLDAVEIDSNEVLLRIACDFNPGHATNLFAVLRAARLP